MVDHAPPQPILRFDFTGSDGTQRLGRGKIMLLEHIRATGSISAAGRAMDMSYRRAWLLVSAINALFAQEAVTSQRGGRQGGGALVTPFGEELIHRFHAMEDKATAAMAQEIAWLHAQRAPADAPDAVTDPARPS